MNARPAEHHILSSVGGSDTCPRCGGQLRPFSRPLEVSGTAYRVMLCPVCGAAATLPEPDPAQLQRLYSTRQYRNSAGARFYTPVEWLVEGMRRWRIRRIGRYAQEGSVLDIGCGGGRFLRTLRDAGWEVAGLELNDETAASARRVHGLRVETSLAAFEESSFDLITITHVLEHVRDPQGMLSCCARLVRPGGVIAVAVPNIGSWQARLTKGGWFHLDLPRHLWHFSEAWLERELRQAGFTILDVQRFDPVQNVFGWLQSLLNVTGISRNRLYLFMSADDLKDDHRPQLFSLAVSLLLLPLLFPLACVLAVTEACFRAGGTVEMTARLEKAP